MLGRLEALAQFLVPGRREESSNSSEDMSGKADRRLLSKHEQFSALMATLMESCDSRILVAQIMTQRHMNSVHHRVSVKVAREAMQAGSTRHLLVHDDDEDLAGIISDKDLLQRRGRTAGCIMTKDPITVSPDCLVERALSRVIRNRVSCLPVVAGVQAIGVVTRTDLLLAFEALLELVREYNLLDSKALAIAKSTAAE